MPATRLTRSERTALTRRELLAAAELRFLCDGYHGTSLDDVAEEAGYTKGAVYSTFKSKAGLFLALMDEVIDRRLEEFRALIEDSGPNKLLAALAEQPADTRNSEFLLLTIEFLVHAAREPALLAAVSERYRLLRARLAALGPASSPLGSERWALVTLALSNGFALERLIDPSGVPTDLMAAVQALIATPARRQGPQGASAGLRDDADVGLG